MRSCSCISMSASGRCCFTKGAVLRAEGIDDATFGLAAIKALILGKFMLIGHALRLGERHADRPLIYSILRQSFVFLGLLLVLDLIEEVVVGALHGRSVAELFAGIADGSWLEILATCIIVFLILVPYFAYRGIDGTLGERRLFWTLFGER